MPTPLPPPPNPAKKNSMVITLEYINIIKAILIELKGYLNCG